MTGAVNVGDSRSDGDTVAVLVVDDDTEYAELTATYLERDDPFDVAIRFGGNDALDTLATGSTPDCIVSDHDMPDINGLEFLAAVRETHPELPFILFTGNGNEEIASEAVTAGVTDYVKKGGPEQYDVLANRVQNAVERRRSQKALREEKELLEQVLATTPGSIVCNESGDVTYATARAARTLGLDLEVLAGSSWKDPSRWSLTDYDGTPLTDGELPIAMTFETGERVTDAEVAISKDDGSTLYLSVDVAPLASLNTSDGVDRAVVSFRDVTDRIDHERLLRESQQKYASVVKEANDGVVIAQDGVIKFVNSKACDILRGEEADFLGEPVPSVVAAEDRKKVADRLRRRLSGENVQGRYEFTARALDGTKVPIESTASVVTYEGAPAMLAICRDVSKRKQRERELEQYETIVQTAPDGVFIVDEEANYVRGNIPGAELTGYSQEELHGKSVPELVEEGIFGEEVIPRYTEMVQHLLSAENDDSKGTFEFTISNDGRTRIYECHVSIRPFDPEARETFRGSIGVLRDVTERIRRERELERQNERLEEFANVVGHDLRNPLNVASGNLMMAREGDSTAFDRVSDAHTRMAEMLDDLLTLARTGQSVDETDRVHLQELATSAWGTVDTANATLELETDLEFDADPGRIKQLLENLFGNAVTHVGDNVTVTVDALPNNQGFSVIDDGPGISTEHRSEIFDPGFTTRESGTGFGLAIVHDIADAHGWDVELGDRGGTCIGVRFD